MPTTAYSNYFRRELDAAQLLASARQVTVVEIRPGDEISTELRAWIRSDVICASCGRAGAQIVRPATSSSGHVVRQPHFRSQADDGRDAHHPYCEFYGDDEAAGPRQDALLDFGSARTIETREIRELVCRGIDCQLFDQGTIRQMRQWFFDLKVAQRFTVTAPPRVFAWMTATQRRQYSYYPWDFDPSYGELPNFDWTEAARRRFEQTYGEGLQPGRRLPSAVITRARDLAARFAGLEVFDPAALEPYYQGAINLAAFLVVHGGYFKTKYKPEYFRLHGAPAPLLALCALLLFRNRWDQAAAVAMFAQILGAPTPEDMTLGNVMGLNPFHDYAAWQAVKVAEALAADKTNSFDYPAQLAAFEAELRERHRDWRSRQPG